MTSTEIRVAWPVLASTPATTRAQYEAGIGAMFEYFNRHFELFGRRLVPAFVSYPTSANTSIEGNRAAAAEIAAANVFAAMDTTTDYWLMPYFQELARQEVVTVIAGNQWLASDRDLLRFLAPVRLEHLPLG